MINNVTKILTGLFCILGVLLIQNNVVFAQGNALELNKNDYVDISTVSSSIDGTGAMTISLWAKVREDNYEYAFLFSKYGGSYGDRSSINFDRGGSLVFFNLANGANTLGRYSEAPDGWHHYALVFDGSGSNNSDRLKAYVDGVEVSLSYVGTIPTTTTTDSGPVELAKQYTYYNASDITLDEVRIFTSALSSSDISNNLYNYISTSTSGLLAYYKMDDNTGYTVTDAKGAYHGELWDKATGRFDNSRTDQWVPSTVPTKWKGTTSTVWATGSNWSWADRPPTTGQDVIIGTSSNDAILASDVELGKLRVDSSANLDISANASITLTDELNNSGTLTLKSTSSGTGKLYDNGTVSGSIKVERYHSNAEYHLISAPVSGQDVSLFSDAAAFKNYNETIPAYNGSVSGNFENGRGYSTLYNSATTKTFTGTINTSNVTYGVTSSHYGWNLVGNPFPTSINASTFLSNNSGVIDGTIWLWSQNGEVYANTDYSTYTSAGVFTAGVSGLTFNGKVEVGQGFWVKANSASNITFARSLRSTADDTYFSPDIIVQSLNISLSNDNNDYNELAIAFHEGASLDYDAAYDGKKMKGNWNMSFYSYDDANDYAIQAFPPLHTLGTHTVPLGIDARHTGSYTLKVKEIKRFDDATSIILEDLYTNQMYDLRAMDELNFDILSQGKYRERFLIHFIYAHSIISDELQNIDPTSDVTTSIQDIQNTKPCIYAFQNNIYIDLSASPGFENAVFAVYDMLGQKIEEKTLSFAGLNKIPLHVRSGVYIIRVQLDDALFSEKLILD